MAGGVANIIAHLQLNISNFTNGMDAASARLDSFSNNLRRSLQLPTQNATTRTYQDIVDVSDQFNVSMDRARRMLGLTRSEYRDIIEQQRRWNAEVERSRFAFKDVARIIGGIIVAKIFYTGMQSINRATDAVWEFSKAVEYAQITYANLFGDVDLSNEFINVLQDFAAETVFSFSEAEAAARRLLSYGIQYKNVMYMMQGVMAGATITGNEQNVERISRALGQIYTKGRLMGEEMRQLAEAGVPAYEILIEKLGLTQKQLQNLGRESIPASKAINALVEGINERFGNVVNAAAFTTTGLINKIQDNALLLANGIFEPVLVRIKGFLSTFANWLSDLREVYNKSGVGGVFESIVPPHLQETVRIFIANLMTFGRTIGSVFKGIGTVIAHTTVVFMNLFNMVMPIINVINGMLSTFMSALFGTKITVNLLSAALTVASGALIIFLVNMARVAIVKLFTKAITGLSKALAILSAMLTRHPVLFFISMLAVGIAGMAMSNEKFRQSVNKLTGSLTKLSGTDPSKVMMPESKERAADLGKFNNKLEDTADAMEDLAGKTGKATKAGKQLLSFDEVFRINEPDEGTDSGIDSSALDNIDVGGLDLSGLTDGIEIPSFDEIAGGISSAFMDALSARMGSTITGAAIGGIIGAAIGSLIGQPILGAKVGLTAGSIAGFFWEEIKAKLTEVGILQKNNIAFSYGAGIGAGIGAVLGGPAGAIVGAAIGALATGLFNLLWAKLAEVFNKKPEDATNASIGTGIGAAIGGIIGAIFGGPAGAIIGAAIGALAGGTVGLFWEDLKEGFTNLGQSISGWCNDVISDIKTYFNPESDTFGGWLTGTVRDFTNWKNETKELFSSWVSDTGSRFGAWWSDTSSGFTEWYNGTFSGLSSWWDDTVKTFSDWDSINEGTLGNWWRDTKSGFDSWKADTSKKLSDWWNNTTGGFGDWSADTFGGLATWWNNSTEGFSTWASDTWTRISGWWSDVENGFNDWKESTGEKISEWWSDTKEGFSTWASDTWKKITDWSSDTDKEVTDWSSSTRSTVSIWESDVMRTIGGFAIACKEAFKGWASDTKKSFDDWKTEVGIKFSTWKTNVVQTINGWSMDVQDKFHVWKLNAEDTIETWKINTSTKFSGWKTSVEDTIGKWKENVGKYVSDWSTNAVKKIDDFIFKKTGINDFCSTVGTTLKTWAIDAYTNIKTNFDDSIKKLEDFLGLETSISDFCKNTLTSIKDWASEVWESIKDKFGKAVEKIKEFVNKSDEANKGGSSGPVFTYNTGTGTGATKLGHATGGIFNKEHIARFAEGNKAEAIIPLENASAMRPFVDAVSNGLIQSLLPALASAGNGPSVSDLPPMYVGTLIADERGLRELNKKMKLIDLQENARRGN